MKPVERKWVKSLWAYLRENDDLGLDPEDMDPANMEPDWEWLRADVPNSYADGFVGTLVDLYDRQVPLPECLVALRRYLEENEP